MKKLNLLVVFGLLFSIGAFTQNAWFNEFHYDNDGGDVNEFIEIVLEDPTSYTLSDFTVELYNGNGGGTYGSSTTLDAFTLGSTSGNYAFYYYVFPSNGIQNGAPDGLALSYQGTVIPGQFLSYEGQITATGGNAIGMSSVDIGVSEPSNTTIGFSLQLIGTGSQYSNFSWTGPIASSMGAINASQSFGVAVPPTQLAITDINGGSDVFVNTPFEIVVQAQDATNATQNVTSDVNITLTLATGTGALGGTLTGTILNGTSSVTISGITYDTEESGVSITATDDASGLTAGTSATFDVMGLNTVTSIADLRNEGIGTQVTLTSEAILTFQQSYRNQKYIEDATAAILIDDVSGNISTVYNIGDGITGISGTLGEYNGMLQFLPDTDPGVATSTGNTITPQVISLATLTANFEDYEAELITVNDVTFADAGGTFATGQTYVITDASKGTFNFYTNFYSADYIGGTIPSTANVTMLAGERSSGQIVTARSLSDFVIAGLPTIDKAYAISDTEVEVYYNIAPSSVDPGDFYLQGTGLVTFSGAAIDGTDPNLVHLTGGSPAMTGDITVDELFDDAYGSSYVFYAGILPISLTNVNNPGGTISNDTMATFQGIVSANDAFNNVWISDASGQYNGVLVYDNDFDALAAVGDDVVFAGVKDIYSNVTEIKNAVLVNTASTGNTPYGPDIIPGSDIDETIGTDTNPAEAWEGQLVNIEDFTVDSYVDYDYRCSWSDGSTTYYFHIGDNVDYHLTNISLSVGATYQSVTGVVDWDYTNLYYRINPRDINDIEISSNPASQLAIVSVNGGIDPYTNTDFEVVVQAQDAMGSPAAVSGDVNFTFTTDGGMSGAAFVTGTTTTGTILDGTSEITVTGVQMDPASTDVTITANDDAVFGGLLAGSSAAFDVVEFIIPDIIITEIMQNPSAVADGDGEWFEVYNNSDTPVDMDGWTVKDDGSNSHTISGTVLVPAYGFAVLGINADALTNGGVTVDYEYSSFTLGNGEDEVVLVLPDGVTEVDRVNYDGGPVWPDPAGASMTYTGFANEENNDGTKWVWSTFREGNYDASADDKGSPGTDGYDQIVAGGFKLDMKVYLESPFVNADSMSNYYRANSMLTYYHPFDPVLPYYGNNSPSWQLSSNDTLSYIPFLTTDWLLVEVRDASSAAGATGGTMVAQYPALLSDTGTIVSLNGTMPLNIKESFSNDLYVVVYSLNHLAVMNATGLTPADGTVVSYDFSTGSGQYYGGTAAAKELEAGVWGMMSGDVNGDQTIDGSDLVDGWNTEAGSEGAYQGSNLYQDGQIDNKDKNDFIIPNMGMSSSVPN